MGQPKHFIIDRLKSYNKAIKTVLNESTHLPVQTMSSYRNNNLIESFNKEFKAVYKTKKTLTLLKKPVT